MLSFTIVNASTTSERFSLEKGRSVDFNGKRLTLMNIDFENERTVICLNGQKAILGSKTKTIDGATLDLRKVTLNKADIRMWVGCEDCECDDGCDNTICFDDCYKDSDCDDGNDLTDDSCSGNPRRCNFYLVRECTVDEHCDDLDDCTIDKCSDVLGSCIHTEKESCNEPEEAPITGSSTMDKTGDYAKNLHPLILSLTIGFMILAVMIKKVMSQQS